MILYIIKSGKKDADREQTIKSFHNTKGEPFFERVIDVENIEHIIDLRAEYVDDSDWYCVMYDNEYISEGIQFALPMYFASTVADVLIFMKNESGYITQSPRMFRKHVELKGESLMPSEDQGLKYTRVMDGWVKPNVLGGV